jgi:hypothetical protein
MALSFTDDLGIWLSGGSINKVSFVLMFSTVWGLSMGTKGFLEMSFSDCFGYSLMKGIPNISELEDWSLKG